MAFSTGLVPAAITALVAGLGPTMQAQEPERSAVRFTAGVERYTLSVVVRDANGRLVSDLTHGDFEVFDRGVSRPVVEFRVEPGPVTIALVFDVSGSMDVSGNLSRAREAAHQLLGQLDAPGDEVGLFAFDTRLHELRPFARPAPEALDEALAELRPFGTTSLRDAIAAAAARLIPTGDEGGAGRHRAVVVLTDGVDTSSRLTASEVSAAASAVDVPVYVLMTVSPVDHPGDRYGADGVFFGPDGELSDLARWTGGVLLAASRPAHLRRAATEIVSELRLRYWLAVEPDPGLGWHPLEVRTRDRRLTARTRSGYVLGAGVLVQ
jgi:VWFA-related protein